MRMSTDIITKAPQQDIITKAPPKRAPKIYHIEKYNSCQNEKKLS